MFCSNCGTNLNAEDRFCYKCGKQVGNSEEVQEEIFTYNQEPKPLVDFLIRLDCFAGSTFSPKYAYLFFFSDHVEIYTVPSKKMERMIYDYIKEEGKKKKIKLLERGLYRKQYIQNFTNDLLHISDNDLSFKGISKELFLYNQIQQVKFQFTSSHVHHGAEDSHVTKTRGYIMIKSLAGKSKFTHAYGYNKETKLLLENTLGALVKIYK